MLGPRGGGTPAQRKKVLPDPKAKAMRKPKHKERMEDVIDEGRGGWSKALSADIKG